MTLDEVFARNNGVATTKQLLATMTYRTLARRVRDGAEPGLALCLTRQAASAVRDRVMGLGKFRCNNRYLRR